MIPPAESLLEYDIPVLTSKGIPKGRPLRLSPQQPADSVPVPPPPKPKPAANETTRQENEEILNTILPPREWMEGNQLWVQQVSSAPCSRADVIHLEELLNLRLQQRQARHTGICPIRRELYSQCFDELIRQVTINCAERGLLLSRVRDEIQMTFALYQTLHGSSIAFGTRKALQGEQELVDMKQKIASLETKKEDLKRQLNEQKAICESMEKREAEKTEVEGRKNTEEIQYLKRVNQQLKAQIESILKSK
ncbi:axonemal dynein light intermediate polypeptide 1-like [Mugil cephalus]|uniref:axonemal dynein light intermediate polypeptide 1-like n=1 Tax=Mugil cephalus TaxID=48193 RepID=UPI001FB77B40|nr:axonemal dynein light intermediate polypeptide 1-like [Mugil cephalus]